MTSPEESLVSPKRFISPALVALLAFIALLAGPVAGSAQAATPPVKGAIGGLYYGNSAARSTLGQPVSGEIGGPNGAVYQEFANGRIYWSPKTPAMWVRNGGVQEYYKGRGAVASEFGMPMTPVTSYSQGTNGWYLKTYNPNTRAWHWITWSNEAGAVPVKTTGAIGSYWESHLSQLGYPLSVEACNGPICSQKFSRGQVTWSSAAGTHVVKNGFNAYYDRQGGVGGVLGGATVEESPLTAGGAQQTFLGADGARRTTIWHPRQGRVVLMKSDGAIYSLWRQLGAENSGLGYPTSSEISGLPSGGVYEDFDGGKIYWSPATGTQPIQWGPIFDEWARNGYERGSWGYPTSPSWQVNGTWNQNFQGGRASQAPNGTVTWTPRGANDDADLDKAMDQLASDDGFGSSGSALSQVFSGSTSAQYRRYPGGVVVTTAQYGPVAMDNHVFELWRSNAGPEGLPRSAKLTYGKVYTTFEKNALAYFPERGDLVMRTDTALSSGDSFIIGDSQTAKGGYNSWVVAGIRQAGYRTNAVYAMGGIGFTGDFSGVGYGTYRAGVVDNFWQLPAGDPSVVYIGGSGNDQWVYNNPAVIADIHTTLKKIKQAYPNSKIVMACPITKRTPDHNDRNALAALELQAAREEGVRTVDTRYWITDFHVENLLSDGIHMTPAGDAALAPHMRDAFAAATR